MMLPEHVQRLRSWRQEEEQISKPAFDEWTLQALEEELIQAYCCRKEAILEVWHQQKGVEYKGVITSLNSEAKKLCLYNTEENKNHWIEVALVLHIKILE